MRRFIPWAIAAVLLNVGSTGASMDLEKKRVSDFTSAWSRGGPLAWLQHLQENAGTVFYVDHAEDHWIREADVAALVAQMESTVPAGVVCYVASAHAVGEHTRSTVGHEAALLVDAFRRERHYPGSCSDLASVDAAELKRWWAQRSR